LTFHRRHSPPRGWLGRFYGCRFRAAAARGFRAGSIARIKKALEAWGVEFINGSAGKPIVS